MKVEFIHENEVIQATVFKEYLVDGSTIFLCYNEVIVDDPQGLRSPNNPLKKRQSYLIEASKVSDFIIGNSDVNPHDKIKLKSVSESESELRHRELRQKYRTLVFHIASLDKQALKESKKGTIPTNICIDINYLYSLVKNDIQ